jgi:hypothetical protein
MIERQGRTFVTYQGLLDLAHEMGLRSIETHLMQIPNEATKGVAIVTAVVTMERDGVIRTFTGIGDAAVSNVAPAMATCLIRFAETRAKARALRDAVNIGVAAFEELGEPGAQDGAQEAGSEPPKPARSTRQGTARGGSARTNPAPSGKCPHCFATDGREGMHHRPDCPKRREPAPAAA